MMEQQKNHPSTRRVACFIQLISDRRLKNSGENGGLIIYIIKQIGEERIVSLIITKI
jgi:hypothetical protein